MYPPGSTFKLVNGLIALQEGVIFLKLKSDVTADISMQKIDL